ncbi:MAG: aminopeptidase N [Jatrophihabitans sp.]
MTSLTRLDAQQRAATISVSSYAVTLDLTVGERSFRSVTEIRFVRRADASDVSFLDVSAAKIASAKLNGRDLDLERCYDAADARLRLPDLQAENLLIVDARMTYSRDGEGLHRHVDPADGEVYLYAMSFLDAAPRWFACFDQPDLKAPISLDVTCPTGWRVAGNGPAVEVSPGRWTIATTGPLPTYTATVIAGPYHQVQAEHDGIPLVLHARKSLAEHLDRDAAEIFEHTRHCFDELHRLFGVRYPWGEYHQAFVPEFNAGAMENPGCVTFRDQLIFRSRATDAERAVRAVTIAHEMAHMWFGDLVTMRWWDDLWLNESFAEYLGHRAIGEHTWPAFGIERKSWGYRADRRPSTHPVAGNGAADAAAALGDFDGISYAKGASVLRQLAAHLGDEVFLAGLRGYIASHSGGNAQFADLVTAWTEAGATGLQAWTQAWLRTSGLDELRVHADVLVRISPDGTQRPHTVWLEQLVPDGARRQVQVSSEHTPHGLPSDVALLPDAADETWAKIALAPETWQSMGDTLPTLEPASARVVVWNALQLAVADAEVDPALALSIVAAALPVESVDAVLGVVGRWAVQTAATYLDGDARAAALVALEAAMRQAAVVADPASGRQLAVFRVAVAATADVDLLSSWLRGESLPRGVDLDTELRWVTVRRLAELGVLDDDGIGAELDRDPTSAGRVHAAFCRAARPQSAAKIVAWQALFGDPDRSNYELYAMADGLWRPGQDEVTAPFVTRYFAELSTLSLLRPGAINDRLALRMYPWTAVSAATLAATDELLSGTALPPGMRRSVVDAGDDLGRALAARQRFGVAPPL